MTDSRVAVDVLLVGVGGQGVVLAAEVLARAALSAGYDVKKSEVHGLAMRGGAVQSHVRFGRRVRSPRIAPGHVDLLVGFEELESLRFASWLGPNGRIVLNRHRLNPAPVAAGRASYPSDVDDRLGHLGERVVSIDAQELARKAGVHRSENFVILGAVSRFLPLPPPAWREGLSAAMPRNPGDVNLRAFALGLQHLLGHEEGVPAPASSRDTCSPPQ